MTSGGSSDTELSALTVIPFGCSAVERGDDGHPGHEVAHHPAERVGLDGPIDTGGHGAKSRSGRTRDSLVVRRTLCSGLP